MTTPTTDALAYLLRRAATDPALLADLLTRLAVVCAGRADSLALLELFEREFRLERGRKRLVEALKGKIERI